MAKTYKYRIYPDHEQREKLKLLFGNVRFVYNQLLDLYLCEESRLKTFEAKEKHLMKEMQKENPWLKENASDIFSYARSRLNRELANSKRKSLNPRKLRKHNPAQLLTIKASKGKTEVDFKVKKIKIPLLGWMQAEIENPMEGHIRYLTIMHIRYRGYFLKLLMDE